MGLELKLGQNTTEVLACVERHALPRSRRGVREHPINARHRRAMMQQTRIDTKGGMTDS